MSLEESEIKSLVDLDKEKLIHLARLNDQLSALLSLPILVQILFFSAITIWSLCFYRLLSVRQAIFLLLPLVNVLPIDYYSKKIIKELKIKSDEVKQHQQRSNANKSKLIYWQQTSEMYRNSFHICLFSLTTVDGQLLISLGLFIAYYTMLINQTS